MLPCKGRARTVVRSSTLTGHNVLVKRKQRFSGVLLFAVMVLNCLTPSSAVSLGTHLVCGRLSALTHRQRAMCIANPASVAAVGDGLRMAYKECRAQMTGSRWNCSGVGEGDVFGHVMPRGNREAAYTYAITSAGVTHALSAACARGDLPGCGCKRNRRRSLSPTDQFQWGGCGEVAYGVRFGRKFLDARELEGDLRSLMNLHNNRVGRKLVKDLVRRDCKCHGVSGSCSVKTCWRALPSFRSVSAAVKQKYLRAKQVVENPTVQGKMVVFRSRLNTPTTRPPRKSDLVFLESSPSYCEADDLEGVLGTYGRECNKTVRGEGSCSYLCCGRGYNSVRTTMTTQCECRFHWCCHVTCNKCVTTITKNICK